MSNHLKLLGLVIVAMLSMSATASMAQATEFTATAYPATVEGEQIKDYVFTVGPNKVTCKVAKVTISQATPLSLVTEKPTFSSCSVGASPATVTFNGCDFLASSTGTKSISCPPGKAIDVHIYADAAAHAAQKVLCDVSFESQEGLGTIGYKNVSGSPEDITATESLSSIKYTVTGSILCGKSGTGGTLTGEMTLKAKNEGGTPIGYMIG